MFKKTGIVIRPMSHSFNLLSLNLLLKSNYILLALPGSVGGALFEASLEAQKCFFMQAAMY